MNPSPSRDAVAGEISCRFVVFFAGDDQPRAAFEHLADALAWAATRLGDQFRVEHLRLAAVAEAPPPS